MAHKTHAAPDNEKRIEQFARACGLHSVDELLVYPKYVQLETVSLCNARCLMCPIQERQRQTVKMDSGLFEKIAADLTAHADWIEKVSLHLDGEPLLDAGLEEKIAKLKRAGIKMVEFTSNASLMTKERSERIVHSGLDQITFSVDGATARTFEAIRVGLSYGDCVANILNFIKIRDRLGQKPAIRVRMTVQQANEGEFQDFMSFWRGHLKPQDASYGRLLHNSGNWLKNYQLPARILESGLLNAGPCISPWGSFVILADGRVPLCCSDFNARGLMGDVKTSSIQAIWQAASFVKVREGHLKNGRDSLFELCHDCISWDPEVKQKAPDAEETN